MLLLQQPEQRPPQQRRLRWNRCIKDGEENKIFQRFYRGEQARGQEGCGIGLYLSREIVLLQKGIMKATQMKPGLLIEVNLPVWIFHMQSVRSL